MSSSKWDDTDVVSVGRDNANRMLLFKHPLNPLLDHYIYHVCSVGTSQVHVNEPTRGNRWDLLGRHLREFFPSDHPVFLVGSPVQDADAPLQLKSTLADLEQLLGSVHFGTTLFIPGLQPRTLDRNYLALLTTEA